VLIHRAKWVVADPWTVLENAWICEKAGRIVSIHRRRPAESGRIVDYGPNIALIPGLVNAHTHLELSALQGKTNMAGDFLDWVRSVISLREYEGSENLKKAAQSALSGIERSHTALLAEISTLKITREIFEQSRISGTWFWEMIGSSIDHEPEIQAHGLKRLAPAGHGPHTTTPDLLVFLKNRARRANSFFTLHLAESMLEDEFIRTGKGTWAEFLSEREVKVSGWHPRGKSPVSHCADIGILDEKTLAVHLVFADLKDLEIISAKKSSVCICPRSNMALHGKLPDVFTMLRLGIRPCLGTDSLASVDSLDMMDEMAYTADAFPMIAPSEIFAMATLNGADALGFPDLGRIGKGALATMRRLPVDSGKPEAIIEEIVTKGSVENPGKDANTDGNGHDRKS